MIDQETPGRQFRNGTILTIWDINCALNIRRISGEELIEIDE
jgi:hypothetical protein